MRSEHLSRVRFSVQARPSVEEAGPALDWSALESRLRELARFSSESSSETSSRLAVEPHVTLAHDPHDPLAMLEQLNASYRMRTDNSAGANWPAAGPTNAAPEGEHIDRPASAAEPSGAAEHKSDLFDMLSLLAAIPSKQS